jgi:hypothetical protein
LLERARSPSGLRMIQADAPFDEDAVAAEIAYLRPVAFAPK